MSPPFLLFSPSAPSLFSRPTQLNNVPFTNVNPYTFSTRHLRNGRCGRAWHCCRWGQRVLYIDRVSRRLCSSCPKRNWTLGRCSHIWCSEIREILNILELCLLLISLDRHGLVASTCTFGLYFLHLLLPWWHAHSHTLSSPPLVNPSVLLCSSLCAFGRNEQTQMHARHMSPIA